MTHANENRYSLYSKEDVSKSGPWATEPVTWSLGPISKSRAAPLISPGAVSVYHGFLPPFHHCRSRLPFTLQGQGCHAGHSHSSHDSSSEGVASWAYCLPSPYPVAHHPAVSLPLLRFAYALRALLGSHSSAGAWDRVPDSQGRGGELERMTYSITFHSTSKKVMLENAFAITGTTGKLALQCCVSVLKVGPITHHQDCPVGAALSLGLARVSGPSHCALLTIGTLFIVAGMSVTNVGPVARASYDQVFKAAALPPGVPAYPWSWAIWG